MHRRKQGRVKQEMSLVGRCGTSIRASDSSLVLALGPQPAPRLEAENENEPCSVPREGRMRRVLLGEGEEEAERHWSLVGE